ncbi:MAG TPA: hypothetical protein VN782_11975 [Usitatibacter sp.]|nr:hypothetical protein [Usitatibacter sp.]
MTSLFDLLVLASLFAPVALIVAGNLAAYRSPAAATGVFGAYRPAPLAAAMEPAPEAPWQADELRRAA